MFIVLIFIENGDRKRHDNNSKKLLIYLKAGIAKRNTFGNNYAAFEERRKVGNRIDGRYAV